MSQLYRAVEPQPTRGVTQNGHAIIECQEAIKALEKRGVEATGHVVGTRKATRAILREAERDGSNVIVMAADPPQNRFAADLMWSQEPYRVRRRAGVPVYLVIPDQRPEGT